MNRDIMQAVEVINQRMQNLDRIKRMLLDEFGDAAPLDGTNGSKPKNPGNGVPQNADGRREQLAKWLIEHGPATRGAINEKSGIPKGTIATLLAKPPFVRHDGKWSVGVEPQISAPQETLQ